jgi:VWFA-related protein
MTRRQIRLTAFTFAAVAAASMTPAWRLSALQDQQAPSFRTEANYVRVDVYPTRDDAPVTDLQQSDFEVLDNGVVQRIEQFERVVVRAAGPQETRIEPNTVRESRSMLESARARIFVLFLDRYHVEPAVSRIIRKPLVDALDKVIGVDDLVGVMTPEMSAGDIAFARKTTTIDAFLSRYWWGERDLLTPVDSKDQEYQFCNGVDSPITAEMIKRRHEKLTLDALEDLVTSLRGLREERKAVLSISDGWLLYRPNPALASSMDRAPTGPPIGVDPLSGKLGIAPAGTFDRSHCDSERIALSQLDDDTHFRNILDEANRANTSFYPLDPRGLTVFDTPIGPERPPPIPVDAAMLRARLNSLRMLADFTDGLAIVNTNNIAPALKRVVDDLSSYYLLGYYSSGKLDGKFHSIAVRVKRPGVRVRARRGYLAATDADARAAAAARAPSRTAAAAAPTAAAAAEARALEIVLSPLEGYTRPLPIRMHAAAGWTPQNGGAVWAVGELGAGPEWRSGADAEVSLTTAAGETLAAKRVHVDAGARAFRVALAPDRGLTAGDYAVRVRVRNGDAASASDTMRIAVPGQGDATGAIFVRRGPATANREVATSDLRFRRSEQLRIEVPAASSKPVAARLLDRTGKGLAVPVASAVRDDADGSRWRTAQLSLAPLAPGDYVIELAEADPAAGSGQAGEAGRPAAEKRRSLFAFRVIP